MRIVNRLNFLGAVSFIAFASHALLSWFLAASRKHPYGQSQVDFFKQLSDSLAFAPQWLRTELAGTGLFSQSDLAYFIGYGAPLLVQTACFVAALILLARATPTDVPLALRTVFFWASAFAIVSVPAYAVQTQDIWLSIVWGRMTLAGHDPYLIPYLPEFTAGVPLDYKPIPMTYGPLWLLVSSIIAFISGSHAMLGWLLLKCVLLACWIASLVLLRRLAERRSTGDAAVALVIFGWLPVGVHSTIAEGHNDIAMVALLLLWLLLLLAHDRRAWLALAGSIAAKFITAPLIPLHAIYRWRVHDAGATPVQAALRLWPAALIVLALGVFVLPGRMAETSAMAAWHHLEPADLLRLLERALGFEAPGKTVFFRLLFGLFALWRLVCFWRNPSTDNLVLAALALLGAVLFAGVGHVWPWFFVWVLPLAALVPTHWFSVFTIGAATVAPFTIVYWYRYVTTLKDPLYEYLYPSLVMYSVALAAVLYWQLRKAQPSPVIDEYAALQK